MALEKVSSMEKRRDKMIDFSKITGNSPTVIYKKLQILTLKNWNIKL